MVHMHNDHSNVGFIGGGCISAVHEAKPIDSATSIPPTVRRWGSAWKLWLKQHANSVGRLVAPCESLPYRDSHLDLDPANKDPLGIPVLRMTYRLHDQELARFDFLTTVMSRILQEAGASDTWLAYPRLPAAPFQSVFGVTRMGNDPKSSVVDSFCVSHEVPNLAIGGAGCFPTSSGYNPTATIQALALRTADRLVELAGRTHSQS
jgi:gluconate 2-dehydrogenase alpha chain